MSLSARSAERDAERRAIEHDCPDCVREGHRAVPDPHQARRREPGIPGPHEGRRSPEAVRRACDARLAGMAGNGIRDGGVAMIMTPDHPQWDEFVRQLGESPQRRASHEHGNIVRWSCDGTWGAPSTSCATWACDLAETQDSVDWFHRHGGHCDCEVMLNIAVPADEEKPS